MRPWSRCYCYASLSLYHRLELDKLTPTEISLQMADKSTAFPVGICGDVHVVVANVTMLTDFVILDIPEDDAMVVILGRPFLNTAGAVIDCNKGNVTSGISETWIRCPSLFPLCKAERLYQKYSEFLEDQKQNEPSK